MITPSPTSKIDPTHARGTFLAAIPETATKPGYIKFAVPNSSYELHFRAVGAITAQPGKRLVGIVRAQALRIDQTDTGGQFIEPVMGRPRRVQGTVIGVKSGAVIVDAGIPIHCTPTDPRQTADKFTPGQFIGFDVMDGASFEQK